MTNEFTPPWATGPGEILRHGMELLGNDSDTNRRLAMFSIDNSVELMLKTYLGLPGRVTGLEISRNDYEKLTQSFPKLLDAAEKYATDKLIGLNSGEIEWYHRLRNELYHQGNGLTVEREKVEVYAELANLLFENLFGFPLIEPEVDSSKQLGEFMSAWIDFENTLSMYSAGAAMQRIPLDAVRHLAEEDIISSEQLNAIQDLRSLRNSVIHGQADHTEVITSDMVDQLRHVTEHIHKRLHTKD